MKEILISLMSEGACIIFASHILGDTGDICQRTLVLPDSVIHDS
jgi:ABC-type Na+ transport system ATPase subunit NatA